MILGLDASTSCVGWAFYNGTEVVHAGFVDVSKLETNKEKVLHVIYILELESLCKLELAKKSLLEDLTGINLESPLFGFMGGKTSQQTIIKLVRFNAILEYIISEKWKVPVTLIGAMTARKKVLGKARVKGMTGKEYVRQQIDKNFTYLHKFDKMNKRGNPDVRNEDIYDACILAMA